MKNLILFVTLMLSVPQLVSAQEDCNPLVQDKISFTENLRELSDVVKKNNDRIAAPLDIELVMLKDRDLYSLTPEQKSSFVIQDRKKDKYFNYNGVDLALDAGLAGIMWASRDRMPDDKFKHMVGGAIISYGATELAKVYFRGDDHAKLKSILTGVALSTLVGIAKEVYDKQGYGNPEVKDALYTSLGGAMVAVRFSIKF